MMPRPRLLRRILVSVAALAIAIGLLVFSYTSQLTQSSQLLRRPVPTPRFINKLLPIPSYNGPFAGVLCLQVWDGLPLVTKPDTDHIPQNASLTIDGRSIPIVLWMDWGMLRAAQDDDGNSIIIGGPLEACPDLHLGVGLHTVNIQIKAMSGKIYSYHWAFNIQSTDSALYSAVLTATSDTFLATYAVTQTANANYRATCTAARSCPTTIYNSGPYVTYTPSPTQPPR